MGSIFNELKRRNVFRVGIAYLVVSWVILQFVDVVTPMLKIPEWAPTLVLVLLAVGFPIALIFSWAFELTPQGLKKTKEVDEDASITPSTGRRINKLTAGALILALAFIGYDKFISGDDTGVQQAEAGIASIAVLPFEDFSENQDQEYFSDGISEEILNLLAKTKNLRVAARTSSFAFKGSNESIPEIGKKLDVKAVLEGSVRKSGNNVRITAQLINVSDGYHIWSETYDRKFEDIFQIQDEIAASILDSLKVHLLGEEVPTVGQRTDNLEAYNTYLIGKERLGLQTKDDIEAARDLFQRAVADDPTYAPAYVGLANAWISLGERQFGRIDKATVDANAGPAIETALKLAPNSAEAVAVNGLYQLKRFKYDDALKSFNRAIELNPNYALAYLWRSEVYYEEARYLDMLTDKEHAYKLDPMSLEIMAQLAYDYRSFWRPDDADKIIDRMFELHPGHELAYRAKASNLSAHGHYGEAELVLEKAIEDHPEYKPFQSWHAWGLGNIGLTDEALAAGEDDVSYYILLSQGKMGEAKKLVDKVIKDDDTDNYWMVRDYFSRTDPAKYKEWTRKTIAYYDANDIPWRDNCWMYFINDLKETGITDGVESMMKVCRKRTDEAVKAKYLCPCAWFELVQFYILDGQTDEAIRRAKEWNANGDSYNMIEFDPIFSKLSNWSGYQDLLKRNQAQVDRQREVYLAKTTWKDGAQP